MRNIALVNEIVKKIGTPVHILDMDVFNRNLSSILEASKVLKKFKLFYSLKTNYLPAILEKFVDSGLGADVVSGYELKAALEQGFPPDSIVFNGPMKTDNELSLALDLGVFINIDSPEEAYRVNTLAKGKGMIAKVGIRLNPNINMYPSLDVTFNKQMEHKARLSKFGWPTQELDVLFEVFKNCTSLELVGVHCQLGSQIDDLKSLKNAFTHVCCAAKQLSEKFPLDTINFGGGIAVPGIRRTRSGPLLDLVSCLSNIKIPDERSSYTVQEYFDTILSVLSEQNLTFLTVAIEPGRAIVSDAMFMISSLVNKKTNDLGSWIILDAGLNLLPTAGPSEEHKIYPLITREGASRKYTIGGPLCYEHDIFSYSLELPAALEIGDHIVIEDTGAYSISRATNFIRERAPVVAIDENRATLVWRRETYSDIFSFSANSPIEHS
ncbi:diaminopimelate decarboxylase family protein [Pseudomonas sp. RL_5y_Pfl2_73]|uniref:diaminopimelate decarboxylase family protein n=1 Tax=Pseudomonas sp. RL_5y_Pfl2_73 TaxID=3088713 RepID=UPI0030DD80D6